MKKKRFILIIFVLLTSSLSNKFISSPWWLNLSMVLLWIGLTKIKAKYSWIFLFVLIGLNLSINRLFYFKIEPLLISFDIEQSYLNYPGIRESVDRYAREGLWLPYRLRSCFYSNYLIFFSYLTGVAKLLSPLFWVKIIGFSGFSLFLLGIINKSGKKYSIYCWFWVIILSSALRVLGDSTTAVYLTLPVLIYFMDHGFNNFLFNKYQFIWWLFLIFDFLIK